MVDILMESMIMQAVKNTGLLPERNIRRYLQRQDCRNFNFIIHILIINSHL